MTVTRRAFLHQTFVVGPVVLALGMETDRAHAQEDCTLPSPPQATRFVPNEPKVVPRLSAAELGSAGNETQLEQFRGAVGLVRDTLPPTDVIGWSKQVAQHCIRCGPSDATNVHYNWQFLTWHRAFLYFLERILRTLSKQEDLRLVYWDWENSEGRRLPKIYVPRDQSLFWDNRGNLDGAWWPLTDDLVDVQPLLAIGDFETFGGTAAFAKPAAYRGPHANVHNNFKKVADPQAPGGDMRDLRFSPRDPVFYAHHGNIDRLWSSWVRITQPTPHRNPDFGDAKVFFYDETRTWRFVLMNDLRDESRLGYRYSSLMTPKTPMNRLRHFALPKAGPRFTLPSAALAKITAADAGSHYLVIRNIRNAVKLAPQTTQFGIFVGRPAVGVDARSDKGFLGRSEEVEREGHRHAAPLSVSLDVTGRLSSVKRDLDLTIAPLDDYGKTAGPAIPVVADRISLVG